MYTSNVTLKSSHHPINLSKISKNRVNNNIQSTQTLNDCNIKLSFAREFNYL